MAFMSLVAPCFACGRIFACNPDRVPSYCDRPICRDCITLVNAQRAATGREPWPILDGAYEPIEVDR